MADREFRLDREDEVDVSDLLRVGVRDLDERDDTQDSLLQRAQGMSQERREMVTRRRPLSLGRAPRLHGAMQGVEEDPERRARLERLLRTLDRIRMRTEFEREVLRALLEAERLGAARERNRCAAWLESVVSGDEGVILSMRELARALRQSGYG